MVNRIKSCRFSNEFHIELDKLIDHANKFEQQQNSISDELKRLQNDFDECNKREEKCRLFEQDTLNLLEELKSFYEEKISSIKKHYEKQFISIVNKHKSDIQTLRSKYESIDQNNDKKTSKNNDYDKNEEEKIKNERKRLNDQIEELQQDNKRLKIRIESVENSSKQNDKERKIIENDLRKSKGECNKLNDEISKHKTKITELEKLIEKQKIQLNEKDSKINDLQQKNEELDKKISNITSSSTFVKSKCPFSSTSTVSNNEKIINYESASSGIGLYSGGSDNDNNHYDIDKLKSKLSIAEHDIRLTNRRLENKTEICNILREDLKEIQNKLSECEKNLYDEKKRSNSFSELMTTYKTELDQNKQQIEEKDAEIVNLKFLIDENNNNFNLKLKESNDNEKKLLKKINDLNERINILMTEIETCKRNNVNVQYLLEKTTNDYNLLTLNNNELKKKNEKYQKLIKCCEEQLDNYNKKLPNILNQQKTQSNDQLLLLNQEIISLKNKNETLRNEIEDLQLKLIEQQKHMESMIENEKIENKHLNEKLSIELKKINRLEYESNEEKLLFNNRETELIAIKEEAANHITKITKLTKINFELETKIDKLSKEINLLNERIKILNNELNEKCNDIHLFEETISQQKKLIDFMQSNCKCSSIDKKKSLFSFGTKSLNNNNNNNQQSIEELESKLKNEREKNSLLNKRINEIVQELDKRCNDVEKLRIEVLKFKSSSNNNKNNSGEHNFTMKIMKINQLCVACARTIKIGSKGKLCKNCSAIIHNGCRLSNNCGLSLEMVRKKSFGSNYNDEDKNNKFDIDDDNLDDDESLYSESTTTTAGTNNFDSDINSLN